MPDSINYFNKYNETVDSLVQKVPKVVELSYGSYVYVDGTEYILLEDENHKPCLKRFMTPDARLKDLEERVKNLEDSVFTPKTCENKEIE